MNRYAAASVALFALFAGCATGPGVEGERPRRDPDVLVAEEIAASTASNVYDLVRELRPLWLRSRGANSLRDPEPSLPMVYLDGVQIGEVDALRSLPVIDVLAIRFLNARDATSRYGTDHTGGAILVTTKR